MVCFVLFILRTRRVNEWCQPGSLEKSWECTPPVPRAAQAVALFKHTLSWFNCTNLALRSSAKWNWCRLSSTEKMQPLQYFKPIDARCRRRLNQATAEQNYQNQTWGRSTTLDDPTNSQHHPILTNISRTCIFGKQLVACLVSGTRGSFQFLRTTLIHLRCSIRR